MNEYQATDKLVKYLKDVASRKTVEEVVSDRGEDDWFNPANESGGNFDDAYQMGVETGEIEMARTVLHLLQEGK